MIFKTNGHRYSYVVVPSHVVRGTMAYDVGHIRFDIVNHVKFCMVMINRCLYNVIGYVTGQHITWLSVSYERCHPCSTGLQVSP